MLLQEESQDLSSIPPFLSGVLKSGHTDLKGKLSGEEDVESANGIWSGSKSVSDLHLT